MTRDNWVLIELVLNLEHGPAWIWSIRGKNDEGLVGVTANGTVPYYGDLSPDGGEPRLYGVLKIVQEAAERLERLRK